MLNRRWVDIAVALAAVVIALALVVDGGGAARLLLALTGLGIVVAAYVFVARPELDAPARWRFPVFLTLCCVAIGLAAYADPIMAMMQTLVYPLVWVVGDSRTRGVLGSVLVAAAVFVGFFAGEGFTAQSLLPATLTAVLSALFAIWLGAWITSIAEYGEERARLLAELTAVQDEVRALSRERGAAAERERLARDIHDTLAQTLAGLVILAERARHQSDDGRADAAATTIGTVEQVARDALTESRALVASLAAVPSEPALGAAVDRLVARFRAETGLGIAVETVDLDGAEIDREAQVVVLRCLQETLANVRKHADAATVSVRVGVGPDGGVVLDVRDDGHGFDVAAPRTGYGIDGMRDRLVLAGGELAVESESGAGTRVHVAIPHRSGAGAAGAGAAS